MFVQYDVLLDEDLTELEKDGKLCYFPVVMKPDENWAMGQGAITAKMVESFMPEPNCSGENDDSIIMVCGPPKFKNDLRKILEDELQWTNGFYFS